MKITINTFAELALELGKLGARLRTFALTELERAIHKTIPTDHVWGAFVTSDSLHTFKTGETLGDAVNAALNKHRTDVANALRTVVA